MKVTVRKPDIDLQNNIVLRIVKPEDIIVGEDAIIAIDGSTTVTGVSILRKRDSALFYSIGVAREKDEKPVRFKIMLKRFIDNILSLNRCIDTIYYEEPFIGYATAAPNLMMLRTFVEELIIENEPKYDYIKHSEINNKKWKRLFLAPDKCPTGTDLEKKAVRAKLEQFMPYMKDVTQDEIDAYCMGFVATIEIKNGTEGSLETQKIHKFQYNLKFIGANEDDDMLMEFSDAYTGPKNLLENGISFTDISGKANFEKHIFKTMKDDDKVLIIKFNSNHHGDLILKHRLGVMSSTYEYIYAIVWRKSRK